MERRLHHAAGLDAVRPGDYGWHANAPLIHGGLARPQRTVAAHPAWMWAAIVAAEKDEGVFAPAALVDCRDNLSDGLVHRRHHAGIRPSLSLKGSIRGRVLI